jgi:hyperosmotically inducible protein
LCVAAFLLFGFWTGRAAPTVGAGTVGAEQARQRGAELAEKAAVAAEKVKETVDEAALTGKIKAKMALDDSVKARSVDVSTSGSTVTLTGTVRSVAEHDRAVALARETVGVDRVIDHLVVRP